jgi:hypothetical protein
MHGRSRRESRVADSGLGFSIPGIPISTKPSSLRSNRSRSCSRLATFSRSASSTRISRTGASGGRRGSTAIDETGGGGSSSPATCGANQSICINDSCRLSASSRALALDAMLSTRRCGSSQIRRRIEQGCLTFLRHHARAIHDLRSLQDGIGALEGGKHFVTDLPDRRQSLETVPGRIVTSRQCFADPRWSIAQPDIAIVPTGITELGEAAIIR